MANYDPTNTRSAGRGRLRFNQEVNPNLIFKTAPAYNGIQPYDNSRPVLNNNGCNTWARENQPQPQGSQPQVQIDTNSYDWEDCTNDANTEMANLELDKAQFKNHARFSPPIGSATFNPANNPYVIKNEYVPPLENFFQPSKGLPNLSQTNTWPLEPPYAPPATDEETWKNAQAKFTGFEDDDDKDYVTPYQKAMAERIAQASFQTPTNDLEDRINSLDITSGSYITTNDGAYLWQDRYPDHVTSIIGTVPGNMLDQPDDIWDQYAIDSNKYRHETSQLAVYKFKDQIMAALESNQVTIIEGFTGCGKTTQIPQYILEKYCENKTHCNVVVTQPRRLAAVSVAQRVCDEKNWDLGAIVGYQVGLSRKTSQVTRLTYVTTGILLQNLISKKSLDEYSHIIVDEVHERDLETDLLLLVLKKILVERFDMKTKVILMSATLNPTKFADYFPKWQSNDVEIKAAIVRIPPESTFPVDEYYLDTLRPINLDEMDSFEEPRVLEQCYKMAVEYIISLDGSEVNEDLGGNISNIKKRNRGGVLIFLPGYLEIETMCNKLKETSTRRQNDVENPIEDQWIILPLHSTITSEEQQRVFHRVAPGYRKIVVATNIAESSITVTDMRYVIDFCLTKSLGCDPVTNYTCLRMEWASQDQCTQRKGRVGRVAPGRVYRMVPYQFWTGLGKETIPDMEKSSLENVVLKVKNLNMGSPKEILALAIDPPKLSLIARAIAHLKEVGALTINTGSHYTQHDGDLTPMGIIMSKLPLDVRFSRLIVLGHIFGVLEETVIISAGLCGKSPFSHPFSRRLSAYMSKISWSNQTFSDYFALLCLYRTWKYKWESNAFRDFREERQWAKQYFVQLNMMREINNLVDDITKRLRNLGIDVDRERLINLKMPTSRGLLLKMAIAGAFYPNYFLRSRPSQKEYEKNILKDLSCYNPMHTVFFTGFPQGQPGPLYAESIAMYFKEGNSMPTVHVAGGKVMVHFDPRGDTLGRMTMGVYKAIRMRQIRQNVTFGVVSSNRSYDLLDEELARIKVKPYCKCPQQIVPPLVTESVVKVIVTHLELPDSFWVVYECKNDSICDIEITLNEYAKTGAPMKYNDVVIGCLCVVEFKGKFFRGRIDFMQNLSDILVYLIDRGNSVWRKIHDVLTFSSFLCEKGLDKIEAQALQCRIYGIKHLAKYSGVWNEDAISLFTKLAANTTLYLQVYSVVENVIACDLSATEEFEDGKSIRGVLLNKKMASVLEESYESKENNYTRYRISKFGGMREDEIKYQNDRQIKGHVRPILIKPPPEKEVDTEMALRGPFSPLEMEFTSLCRSAHMKQVQIDRTSVNTVALDQEPNSLTARLLVAGTVNIAHRTGAVLARDTTLMPAVPGLVGLLTMLFCPKLEMRVDFPLGRYTGCISGLGVDPLNKRPIYADHDIEVVFDTAFDQEDIIKINMIRTTMNCILNGAAGADLGGLRQFVCKELNELLERDRPSVEEFWQDVPHKWGLLEEDKLITHTDPAEEEGAVFPSHKTVRMTLNANEAFHSTTTNVTANQFSPTNFEY